MREEIVGSFRLYISAFLLYHHDAINCCGKTSCYALLYLSFIIQFLCLSHECFHLLHFLCKR
jgi:hypothetical protein